MSGLEGVVDTASALPDDAAPACMFFMCVSGVSLVFKLINWKEGAVRMAERRMEIEILELCAFYLMDVDI